MPEFTWPEVVFVVLASMVVFFSLLSLCFTEPPSPQNDDDDNNDDNNDDDDLRATAPRANNSVRCLDGRRVKPPAEFKQD
jgi:hypothetical protein